MSAGGQWQGEQGGQWLNDLFEQELTRRAAEHQLRSRFPITSIDATHLEIEGRRRLQRALTGVFGAVRRRIRRWVPRPT
jgi:hypothetical protein